MAEFETLIVLLMLEFFMLAVYISIKVVDFEKRIEKTVFECVIKTLDGYNASRNTKELFQKMVDKGIMISDDLKKIMETNFDKMRNS